MKSLPSCSTVMISIVAWSAACGGPTIESDLSTTDQEVTAATAVDDRACWTDRDCARGQVCRGARICPPGALCGPLPDTPGECVSAGCVVDGRRVPPLATFGACDACQCQADGTVVCRDFVCLECTPDECGPAPLMPSVLCPDGVHSSGPTCLRSADGICGYQIVDCPPSTQDGR